MTVPRNIGQCQLDCCRGRQHESDHFADTFGGRAGGAKAATPRAAIRVEDTTFQYYSGCRAYKSSNLRTAVNTLDAPMLMDVGGNVGQVWTRVLHYHYGCDAKYENCSDEEQFYPANGFGLWQWKHFRKGALVKTTPMNTLENGQATGKLACKDAYE